MQNTYAIIVAGGKGKRMGRPKQFLRMAGRPMLAWTVEAFQQAKAIDGIILVVAREQVGLARRLRCSKIIKVVPGGRERQDSVRNGLNVLPGSAEIVVIHDGARPAVTQEMIERSVREARRFGAVVIGVPVKDTVKQLKPPLSSGHLPLNKGENKRGFIKQTIDRNDLWQAQTPQAFRADTIKQAYAKLRGRVTDDAMAVEKLGIPVKMVMGSYENIKVTAPADLKVVDAILKERRK